MTEKKEDEINNPEVPTEENKSPLKKGKEFHPSVIFNPISQSESKDPPKTSYQPSYGYYNYYYGYSYAGPISGDTNADQYYSYYPYYSPTSYSPPKPSYREHTEGKNLNYAKEYYSHLSRVNSSDETIDYKEAQFFVIKSFNEDNVHKSMKYQIWSSTPEGNKRLNNAYLKCKETKIPLLLLFSVNGSKQFVGVAKMTSEVNFTEKFALWDQDGKWLGKFKVEWIFIKDIPNREFKSIQTGRAHV